MIKEHFMQPAFLHNSPPLLRLISAVILLLLSNTVLSSGTNTSKKPLIVSTYSAAIEEYNAFLKSRNPIGLTSYKMQEDVTRRVILEMLLLQQALHRGGLQQKIRFQASSSDDYNITLDAISSGKVLMHSDSYWKKDLSKREQSLYISDASIEHGQYVVGLYTSPNNQRVLKTQLNDISTLSAVSRRAWSADWKALERLNLKELREARHWRLMASMVMEQDIDFLLVPFQGTPNQVMGRGKFRLIPIPNIKLALNDSRHFAISKKHTDGEKIHNALNIGIRAIKKDGTWLRAYRESGVLDPRVDHWQLIP